MLLSYWQNIAIKWKFKLNWLNFILHANLSPTFLLDKNWKCYSIFQQCSYNIVIVLNEPYAKIDFSLNIFILHRLKTKFLQLY